MDPFDFPSLLGSIQRCDAAYEMDDAVARTMFTHLGCKVLGRLSTDNCQGVASIAADGRQLLTGAGTRFSEGPLIYRFSDLAQDIHFYPYRLPGGGAVASGALDRMHALWAWAEPLFDPTQPVHFEGHSLDGQSMLLAPAVVAYDRIASITAWEPPKAADAAFWRVHAGIIDRILQVVHGDDPFFAWPPLGSDLQHAPARTLWLRTPSGWSSITGSDGWSGPSILAEPDHDTTTVISALFALVAAGEKVA
jgi:hypothetical protein